MISMRRLVVFALFSVLASSNVARPQGVKFETAVKDITAKIEPPMAKPGQVVDVSVTISLNDGYHTYPTVQPEDGAKTQVNKFTFPDGDLIYVGEVQNSSNYESHPDETLKVREKRIYHGSATYTRKAVVSPKATPGEKTVGMTARVFVCDKDKCLPPRSKPVDAKLTILPGSEPVPEAYRAAVEAVLGNTAPNPEPPSRSPIIEPPPPPPGYAEGLQDIFSRLVPAEGSAPLGTTTVGSGTGLGGFLLAAAFWGLISLFTPCVFPMIPITVSFFLKKGHEDHKSSIKHALIYCGTIIVVLGTSAFTLLSVFRALSVDPYMNLFLGGLFVFFALSLFGMYDITLPNFLVKFTGSRERSGGIFGTVFMALTFTIISFTCVAPFLGGFSGMAASGQFSTFELLLGGLTYATAFAAPFFLLALFPSLLKSLPRAGNWMNTVKVVMGFLELAAALKFFRTAELLKSTEATFFTYDVVLGAWVAISVFCGLYLLNLFRLPHDYPQEHIGVTRMLFGMAFVGLGFYLMPAMFRTGEAGLRQRPSGIVFAWVDAFLLPDTEAGERDLYMTLDIARREREKTGKPEFVFVDFTGESCTNCRYNEENIFTKPAIAALLKSYRVVQLYTDVVPRRYYRGAVTEETRLAEASANLDFQTRAFGDERLPLYVVLEPLADGKIRYHGPYLESKIDHPDRFTEFLEKPLSKDGK